MFVKHIIDEDILSEGFVRNPLFNESFSRQHIDTTFISTYMHVWSGFNCYRYMVVTDREGEIDRGTLHSVTMFKQLTDRYFANDITSFIKRKISQVSSGFNSIENAYFTSFVKKIDAMEDNARKETMLNLFGESHA